MQRGGVGDRVHAVERMGEVDEPALRLDRGDRVAERHPARDLLVQEEADHLALAVRLHLLAADDDDVAVARELDDLLRAGEDVVVGDRDRAEAFGLRVLEQQLGRDPAVVRRARVHVQVDDDPVAVARAARRRACALRFRVAHVLVDLLELVRDVGERLPLGRRCARLRARRTRYASSSASRPISAAASCGCSCVPGGAATAAPAAAASSASRERPFVAGTKIAASLRIAARLGESRAVLTSTRSTSVRGTYGRVVSGFVRSSVSRQSGSSPSVCSAARSSGRSVWRHSSTISRSLSARLEQRRVDAFGDDAGSRRGSARPPRRPFLRDVASSASIRPSSFSRCARPGGYDEALGREERRDGRLSASRSARYERLGRPGSKPCTTSKRPSRSARERFVRTPTGTPTRLRREIGTAGPRTTSSLVVERAVVQRDASRREIGGAVRRRDDRDGVAERAQLSARCPRRARSRRAAATRRTA